MWVQHQLKQAQLPKTSIELLQALELASAFQQALAQNRYSLSVKLSLKGDCDDYGARRIAHAITGIIELECWDEEWNELTEVKSINSEPKPIEVGHITGWRTLSSNSNKILLWSDRINPDVCSAFNWLTLQQVEAGVEAALFIEQVVIKPCWQRQQLTLKAVATYLDLVGCSFVFLRTASLDGDHLTPQQQNPMKQWLSQHWQELGLKHHDLANNIVWTDQWRCPQELQAEDDYICP